MNPSAKPSAVAESGAVVQTSRLLTIPGEIRNRIYKHALESMHVKTWRGEHITLVHPQRGHKVRFEYPATAQNWRTLYRMYLGLTQACRQTRAEFLPLEKACLPTYIALEDMLFYIQDFVLGPVVDPKNAKAHIILEPGEGLTRIDPLIRFLSTAPGIQFSTELRGFSQSGMVRLLYPKTKNPKWWKYLTTCVSRVECEEVYLGINCIFIHVKSEYVLDWMYRRHADEDNERNKEKWREEIGLSFGKLVEGFVA